MGGPEDGFEAMSDDDLVRHLQVESQERRDDLAIGERTSDLGVPEWTREISHEGGLAGRTVMYAARGASRRGAMLALARLLAAAGT
ncbi:MAG: hypothetical protein ACTHQQ_21935 [Solirubrobacteraceae bacterium]